MHALIELLGMRIEDPDFSRVLQERVGETEEWEDDGNTFFTNRSNGIEVLASSSGEVRAIFLFGRGRNDGPPYQGEMPRELDFGFPRAKVRRELGQPNEHGDARVFLGGEVYPWDKFKMPDYSLHIRYTRDERQIDQIILEQSKPVETRSN